MRKLLSIVLCFSFLLTCFPILPIETYAENNGDNNRIWDGTIAESYASGKGTKSDPYIIETPEQLARIAFCSNSPTPIKEDNMYYKLVSDIYLNDVSLFDKWGSDASPILNEWEPIGNSGENSFRGAIDGNGHSIYGIYVNSDSPEFVGFIGNAGNLWVKDLHLKAAYIKGNDYVGGLCGYVHYFAEYGRALGDSLKKLDNCSVDGIIIGNNYVGGLIGASRINMMGSKNFYNLSNSATVTGNSYVGGIFGESDTNGIYNSYNIGNVTGADSMIGGIAGTNNSLITGSWNVGEIRGLNNVGGIVGQTGTHLNSGNTVQQCFNSGTVHGNSYVGGVAGRPTSSTVKNCYNTGTIYAEGDFTGGVVGQASGTNVRYSYNAGVLFLGRNNSNQVCGSKIGEKLFYKTGCVGTSYEIDSSENVIEMSEENMRSQDFLDTLNEKVSVWEKDISGYNAGFPILSVIDYETVLEVLKEQKIIQLMLVSQSISSFSNVIPISSSVNASIGVYNREILDPMIKDIIISVSDESILTVTPLQWSDTHGQELRFYGKRTGQTTVLFSVPSLGIQQKIDIWVVDREAGFTFNFVPESKIVQDHITNFYNYCGLTIEDFTYTENLDNLGNLTGYDVTFTVYNTQDIYGSVVAYDQQGKLSNFRIIKKKEPGSTDFIGTARELVPSVQDLFKLIKNEQYYAGKTISASTTIDISVPVGGYISITCNPLKSPISFFANIAGLYVDGTGFLNSVKSLTPDKASSIISKVDTVCSDPDIKAKIVKKIIEKLEEKKPLEDFYDEIKDKISENLGTFQWNFDGFDEFWDYLYDWLLELGIDISKIAGDVILDTIEVTPDEALKLSYDVFNDLNSFSGKIINGMFTFAKALNLMYYIETVLISTTYPSINLYSPSNISSFPSNGIVSESNLSDPELVIHAYRLDYPALYNFDETPLMDYDHEVYSISMYRNGEITQPSSRVTVFIPIPERFLGNEDIITHLIIYRCNDDGTLTKMSSSIYNGYIMFSTDHFSYYAIIKNDSETTPIVHKIEFNSNGGDSETVFLYTDKDEKIDNIPIPERDKYRFVGWFTDPDGGVKVEENFIYKEDITLFAHWEQVQIHSVQFDLNGALGSNIFMQTTDDGTLTSLPTPTRDGYIFEGWFTSLVGGQQVDTNFHFTEDAILYAHWIEVIQSHVYTISVDVTPIHSGTVSGAGTYNEGEHITLIATPSNGYRFNSWTENGVSISNREQYQFIVTSDRHLTANYERVESATPGNQENTPSGNSNVNNTSNSSSKVKHQTNYKISEHGLIDIFPKSAYMGQMVTITVNPYSGFHISNVNATTKSGKLISLDTSKEGVYTLLMPDDEVEVDVVFEKCSSYEYTDIDEQAWYHLLVDTVISRKIMIGIDDKLFSPYGVVSRAQMITVFWNLEGKPKAYDDCSFNDVNKSDWFFEAISWGYDKGILKGYGNGDFGPNDTITREQMATMFYRYNLLFADDSDTDNVNDGSHSSIYFADSALISDWAVNSVRWCVENGMIVGKSNNVFDPKGQTLRCELAAILSRYVDQLSS